jgi:hypothetical protein
MKNTKRKHEAFKSKDVATVFEGYTGKMRSRLMHLRSLIFKLASQTAGVGPLEETLKWGSPSYLTTATKSGTTLRIDSIASQHGKYALAVHCQTNLVNTFRQIYGDEFTYDKTRGLILDVNEEIPEKEVCRFIVMALTYHLNKKQAGETWQGFNLTLKCD